MVKASLSSVYYFTTRIDRRSSGVRGAHIMKTFHRTEQYHNGCFEPCRLSCFEAGWNSHILGRWYVVFRVITRRSLNDLVVNTGFFSTLFSFHKMFRSHHRDLLMLTQLPSVSSFFLSALAFLGMFIRFDRKLLICSSQVRVPVWKTQRTQETTGYYSIQYKQGAIVHCLSKTALPKILIFGLRDCSALKLKYRISRNRLLRPQVRTDEETL